MGVGRDVRFEFFTASKKRHVYTAGLGKLLELVLVSEVTAVVYVQQMNMGGGRTWVN